MFFTPAYIFVLAISIFLVYFIARNRPQWFKSFRTNVLIFACILGVVMPILTLIKSFASPNLIKVQSELIPLIRENKVQRFEYTWLGGCSFFVVDAKEYCPDNTTFDDVLKAIPENIKVLFNQVKGYGVTKLHAGYYGQDRTNFVVDLTFENYIPSAQYTYEDKFQFYLPSTRFFITDHWHEDIIGWLLIEVVFWSYMMYAGLKIIVKRKSAKS